MKMPLVIWVMAVAAGLGAVNLHYSQPLLPSIASSIHVSLADIGWLTHAVNYIDVRYQTGRRRATAPQSGLKEVDEVGQKRTTAPTGSLTSERGH